MGRRRERRETREERGKRRECRGGRGGTCGNANAVQRSTSWCGGCSSHRPPEVKKPVIRKNLGVLQEV